MEKSSSSSQLRFALRERHFVRMSRRFEKTPVRGYVLDVGPHWFLLALVSDRIWFDGFECFRLADVSDIQRDKFTQFAETALQMRGECIPPKPQVGLANVETLLHSASRAFPLVTVHCEEVDPSVCHIGRVIVVNHGKVSLLEIDPNATWEKQPTEYQLDEITRVNFGGDYEGALYLVGGEPAVG